MPQLSSNHLLYIKQLLGRFKIETGVELSDSTFINKINELNQQIDPITKPEEKAEAILNGFSKMYKDSFIGAKDSFNVTQDSNGLNQLQVINFVPCFEGIMRAISSTFYEETLNEINNKYDLKYDTKFAFGYPVKNYERGYQEKINSYKEEVLDLLKTNPSHDYRFDYKSILNGPNDLIKKINDTIESFDSSVFINENEYTSNQSESDQKKFTTLCANYKQLKEKHNKKFFLSRWLSFAERKAMKQAKEKITNIMKLNDFKGSLDETVTNATNQYYKDKLKDTIDNSMSVDSFYFTKTIEEYKSYNDIIAKPLHKDIVNLDNIKEFNEFEAHIDNIPEVDHALETDNKIKSNESKDVNEETKHTPEENEIILDDEEEYKIESNERTF